MNYSEQFLPVTEPEARLDLDESTIRGLAYCALLGSPDDHLGYAIAAALETLPDNLTITALGGIYQHVRHYVDECLPRRIAPKLGHHHARAAMAVIATEAVMKEDATTALNVCRVLDVAGQRRARTLSRRLRTSLFNISAAETSPPSLQTA